MKAKDFLWVLVMGALVAASFVAAGLRSGGAAAPAAGERPVTVERADGTDVPRVTLSPRTVERLGIATGAGATAIPYSAVLYDLHGDAWVYTNPEPQVYVRQRVRVDRIDGDRVMLTDGLPAATTIVTVGGAELLAAELGH